MGPLRRSRPADGPAPDRARRSIGPTPGGPGRPAARRTAPSRRSGRPHGSRAARERGTGHQAQEGRRRQEDGGRQAERPAEDHRRRRGRPAGVRRHLQGRHLLRHLAAADREDRRRRRDGPRGAPRLEVRDPPRRQRDPRPRLGQAARVQEAGAHGPGLLHRGRHRQGALREARRARPRHPAPADAARESSRRSTRPSTPPPRSRSPRRSASRPRSSPSRRSWSSRAPARKAPSRPPPRACRERRSSPSWVTSTTARRRCSTRSARPNVAAGEAGGITQHIGAYRVEVNGQADRLPRHARPRGLHLDARPRRAGRRTSSSSSSPPTTP